MGEKKEGKRIDFAEQKHDEGEEEKHKDRRAMGRFRFTVYVIANDE